MSSSSKIGQNDKKPQSLLFPNPSSNLLKSIFGNQPNQSQTQQSFKLKLPLPFDNPFFKNSFSSSSSLGKRKRIQNLHESALSQSEKDQDKSLKEKIDNVSSPVLNQEKDKVLQNNNSQSPTRTFIRAPNSLPKKRPEIHLENLFSNPEISNLNTS